MNSLVFIINTPGQSHTWKNVMKGLTGRGHAVNIVARDYGSTAGILNASGFAYRLFKPMGSGFLRVPGSLWHFKRCHDLARDFRPDMFIGFGIDAAITARLFGKPSVLFIDDDHTIFQNRLAAYLTDALITPDCFIGQLGRRHVRVNGYKELAYLHPNYFRPDPSIYKELGIGEGERYVLLRFNAWDAVHDIGSTGFTTQEKMLLVENMERHARVFISPEGGIPAALKPYVLNTPNDRFHHVLAYARLFVSDTGTSTTEAAMLGTPAVFCHAQTRGGGNFKDLQKYGLIYQYGSGFPAIGKATELIQRSGLKEEWAEKRTKLLSEKVDVGEFLTNYIDAALSGRDSKRASKEMPAWFL